MSYQAEVIADSTNKWVGNGLRFATKDEAQAYVDDLFGRWTAVREGRVTESPDPVNYAWANGRADLINLEPAPLE